MNTKKCKKCNKEKEIEEFRKNRNSCKDCEKQYAKEYRYKNHDIVIERTKIWKKNNIEKIKQYEKNNRKRYLITEKRKIYCKNYMKRWRKNNKEHINNYKIEKYHKDKKNELYKLKIQTRSLIYISFKKKGYIKNTKTEQIIGCKLDYFIDYLLETYKNNYGVEWDGHENVHIDHIIPLSTAKTEEDVIKLCHYTNLQLLKAKDNLHKSNKLHWNLKEDN